MWATNSQEDIGVRHRARRRHLDAAMQLPPFMNNCMNDYIIVGVPYGQLKRRKRSLAFPKTFSFELRFWHNFVPDMHDSSENFQGPANLRVPQWKCKTSN